MLFLLGSCIYEEPPLTLNPDKTIICFDNYLGNIQNIHPKVLYFEDGWNGYEFWMAYTPYPRGNPKHENPCIAASHDGENWETPAGLSNPLAYVPEDGYNSDTHLVYDAETDRLECWWRPYERSLQADALLRRVSYDGISWGEVETMLPFGDRNDMRMSHSVWIQDDKYKSVYSNGFDLLYIEAPKGDGPLSWSAPQPLPIDYGGLGFWHHDVILDPAGDWEIVACADDRTSQNRPDYDLYYTKLKADWSSATQPVLILERGTQKEEIDSKSMYRPSIVRVGEEYFVYFSCISQLDKRCTGLIRFPSLP